MYLLRAPVSDCWLRVINVQLKNCPTSNGDVDFWLGDICGNPQLSGRYRSSTSTLTVARVRLARPVAELHDAPGKSSGTDELQRNGAQLVENSGAG